MKIKCFAKSPDCAYENGETFFCRPVGSPHVEYNSRTNILRVNASPAGMGALSKVYKKEISGGGKPFFIMPCGDVRYFPRDVKLDFFGGDRPSVGISFIEGIVKKNMPFSNN